MGYSVSKGMGTGLYNAHLEKSKQIGLARGGDKYTENRIGDHQKGRGFSGWLVQSHFTDEEMESQRG